MILLENNVNGSLTCFQFFYSFLYMDPFIFLSLLIYFVLLSCCKLFLVSLKWWLIVFTVVLQEVQKSPAKTHRPLTLREVKDTENYCNYWQSKIKVRECVGVLNDALFSLRPWGFILFQTCSLRRNQEMDHQRRDCILSHIRLGEKTMGQAREGNFLNHFIWSSHNLSCFSRPQMLLVHPMVLKSPPIR